MSFYKEHKRGIVGTIIYHVILLLILIFLGFFTPLPLPGEEGILVNFGTSNRGLGEIETSPQKRNPEPVQQVRQVQRQTTTPPPPSTPLPSSTKPEPAKEELMTQDYEKTVAIDAAEAKKKQEEEQKKQEQLAEERRKQDELEKQWQAELERQQQIEAERKKQEEEQKRIAEINSLAKGAFGESNSGNGDAGNGSGQSQGATFPGGNQGVPAGDSNAGNYGQGGSGSGNQGSGVSYNLSGRSASSLPKPRYPGDDEGLVVVNVTVDKFGNVTSAEPGARGTTIMNQQFWNEARQAALKAKFNSDENAPAFQQGTISYRFVLN